jgi:hypothetical protein
MGHVASAACGCNCAPVGESECSIHPAPETNNLDPQLSLLQTLLTSNSHRLWRRLRSRTSQPGDLPTISKLLTKVAEEYCGGQLVYANDAYPTTSTECDRISYRARERPD